MQRKKDLFRTQTNVPHIMAFKQPPRSFKPEEASPKQLWDYGYPMKPDPKRSPHEYEVWRRIVSTECKRIVPRLKTVDIRHGSQRIKFKRSKIRPCTAVNVTNPIWSGVLIDDPQNKPWGSNAAGGVITAAWNMPAVQIQGVLIGHTPCAVSMWVGFDGYNIDEVLQCGSDAIINPDGSTTYQLWIEWYPDLTHVVSTDVSPGDSISATVAIGPGRRECTVHNYTKKTSFCLDYGHPPSTVPNDLVGTCAEWIVEAPQINGQQSILAPFHTMSMFSTNCWGFSGNPSTFQHYSPSEAPTGTIYDITLSPTIGAVHTGCVPSVYLDEGGLPNIIFTEVWNTQLHQKSKIATSLVKSRKVGIQRTRRLNSMLAGGTSAGNP